MKRLILAAAALAVPIWGATAQAASVTYNDLTNGAVGVVTFNYENHDNGTLYATFSDGTHNVAGDSLHAPGSTGSEDSWGIARVSQIEVNGVVVWNPFSGNLTTGKGKGEITAMIYGEQDNTVVKTTNTTAGTTELLALGSGMNIDIYYDDTPEFLTGISTATPSGRTGPSVFTGITDGQLLLHGESVAGVNGPGDTTTGFKSDVTINNLSGKVTSGSGDAWGVWTGGDLASNFRQIQPSDPDFTAAAPPHDFEVHFTTTPGNPDSWTANSNDPLRTPSIGVPTPSTAAMGFVGMAGLAALGAFRRRRTA